MHTRHWVIIALAIVGTAYQISLGALDVTEQELESINTATQYLVTALTGLGIQDIIKGWKKDFQTDKV